MGFNPGLTSQNISIGSVQVENVAGSVINPATEETLQSVAGFDIPKYDYIGITYNATTDVYVFKTGGSGGTTVGTLTLAYSDATKVQLNSVTKS